MHVINIQAIGTHKITKKPLIKQQKKGVRGKKANKKAGKWTETKKGKRIKKGSKTHKKTQAVMTVCVFIL